MGKIKAGQKQSERSYQQLLKEPMAQPESITVNIGETECPVVNDYWARKHSTTLRKELEQLKVNFRHSGISFDEKLMVQEQKLLNEIDGCFQASAMLVDKVNEELNALKNELNKPQEKPVQLQLVKPQETVIEKTTHTVEIKQVMPTYAKALIAGLVVANILILLLK